MWKNTIKKKIFDETPEEMTDFMNVTPRMKKEREQESPYFSVQDRKDIFDSIFDRLDMVREEINAFKSPVTGNQLAVADKVDSKFDEIVELLQSSLKEIYSDPLDE
tara:strand:- start:4149 stop:4466 length:318 start_codon:yes stop_codon:yes gene_type:complete